MAYSALGNRQSKLLLLFRSFLGWAKHGISDHYFTYLIIRRRSSTITIHEDGLDLEPLRVGWTEQDVGTSSTSRRLLKQDTTTFLTSLIRAF